ncbi:hypothetical protein CHELA1G11_21919 [Hyphomicrobiales bacterium]|nr:hypothetical protein CHELA1G2_20183 [Hyphomicrobiales bacterium]CAH1695582.1 hypothetical protein CHELA1G11_21919 [Hyphomicrobiales bacterium]
MVTGITRDRPRETAGLGSFNIWIERVLIRGANHILPRIHAHRRPGADGLFKMLSTFGHDSCSRSFRFQIRSKRSRT